ncbi:hypothetical protein ZWY2020_002474 [Hordeum vulgare]|nr:hypothetical protein ZWY2020_002474 [Hordeum vulgare]
MAMGLVHVNALHDALGDLLDLPKAQGELSGTGGNIDRLLYSFLRLANAHGCFQEAVVALKHDTDATGRAWIRPCGAAQGRQGACTPRRCGQRVFQPSLAPEHPRRWPRQRDGGGGDGAADRVGRDGGVGVRRAVRDQRGLLFASAPGAWRDIYWLPNSTLVVAILCCSGAPLCSSSSWTDGKNGYDVLTHT